MRLAVCSRPSEQHSPVCEEADALREPQGCFVHPAIRDELSDKQCKVLGLSRADRDRRCINLSQRRQVLEKRAYARELSGIACNQEQVLRRKRAEPRCQRGPDAEVVVGHLQPVRIAVGHQHDGAVALVCRANLGEAAREFLPRIGCSEGHGLIGITITELAMQRGAERQVLPLQEARPALDNEKMRRRLAPPLLPQAF